MNADTELRLFIDRLKIEIGIVADECFDPTTDPEVSWSLFIKGVKAFKPEHVRLYLNSDDEN